MTLHKSFILSLFLLFPQPTKAYSFVSERLKKLAIPTFLVIGGSAVIGGIAWLYANHVIKNVKLHHNTLMSRWSDFIATHKNGLDLQTSIISGTWGLTKTPLHAFENELIQAINITQANYVTACDCAKVQHLSSDFLTLKTNLTQLLRDFAYLRTSEAYSIEEQSLLRNSIDVRNRLLYFQACKPNITYVYRTV